MAVSRWNEALHGPLSEPALRRRLEGEGYDVSRYVYGPGTHFPEHTHEVDKIDAVVSGSFQIVVSGRRHILGAGDSIVVPRGVRHSATVLGDEPVISLDAIKRNAAGS
jgi:quercetin dioxygenase-like cupin family protein